MRRDLANELIVAVVAVAVLAFALTFGVIITLSNQVTPASAILLPTATWTHELTPTLEPGADAADQPRDASPADLTATSAVIALQTIAVQ
ncbi:MAG: hypothetical protein NZM00_11020, partial [Anaerolinea sp.]|nr:hypothetical protein [Anaerolinea sp.]